MEPKENSKGPTGERTKDEHYGRLANSFDVNWLDTNAATLEVALRKMDLTPNDVVVDFGAGTGYLAHHMWKSAGLKRPVICVEPSEAMLSEAKLREGIIPVLATAEVFLENPQEYCSEQRFTRAFMSNCVHHFSDPGLVFSRLANHLSKDGFCLILSRPPETTLPLFKAALKTFATSCTDHVKLCKTLLSLGFVTEVTTEVMRFRVQKQQWYAMLRARYMSNLEGFTEEEMEEGIRELEDGVFSGVQDSQLVTINDPILAIVVKLQ